MPTSRNRAPVEIPWLTICTTPPWMPWVVMAKVPRMMKPRWATEEYATRRLRSCCMAATTAP
jgi:hypothetical protein